ncbi:RagB/SusD family nutrient uptake outer membrane protein [Pedobacter immunditicola]|uniref:RagB/SusD family nutrient uptake outer membrane protein n=1 Tax=Pedobacter immunditicola TaxID=3133440 RepID=UPI0030AE68BD
MKKFRYIALNCLLVATLCACNKLEEAPFSTISANQFYKTSGDAQAALTAAYGSLRTIYDGSAILMSSDFSADQVYPRPVVGRNTLTLFSYDPAFSVQVSNNRVAESPVAMWSGCYTGIEKCNLVLEKVPGIEMEEKVKTTILGEAYYLRAYYFWVLTKAFGDVVIKTTTTATQADAFHEKSAKADVYKQIYADLDLAIASLPPYSASIVRGHVSAEVAQALYAKVALYNEDWANALAKAQLIINSGKYSLMPDPRSVFTASMKDAARTENIWSYESESTSPGVTQQMTSLYSPVGGSPTYGTTGFGSAFAYYSFFNSFAVNDKRRQLLDTTYVNLSGTVVRQKNITPVTPFGVLVKKYADPNNIGGATAANIPILRLADIYLIAAEAEARLNGPTTTAYNYIDVVRTRAGIEKLAPGLSATAFIDAVLQERSWELFAEGDRWYDLTRTNTFLTVIPKAINDIFPVRTPTSRNRYFPIPQDEINANTKLTQNDPWK